MEMQDNTFSSKIMAKRLGIESVTVRKYAQILEDKGYIFEKNDRDWRVYTERDHKAFEYLVVLREMGNSVDDSAERVASLYRENFTVSVSDMTIQRQNLNEFEVFKEQQEAFNKELLKRLEKQQEYFDGRLADRDQQLVLTLKEVQETKRLLAATGEKKKNTWWKFW